MQFEPTRIPDVVLIRPRIFHDARGWFFECWNQRTFAQSGIAASFVQENFSRSSRHTLRGLHYQVLQPQGKLVRVVAGEVFDVAVDLRRSSPTFGQWAGSVLSAENRHALWVPPHFAHGVIALSETAELMYCCTDFYAPQHERTIRWDDPDLGIDWPLPPGSTPFLSDRDSAGKAFRDSEYF
jgi:dTDP-4-dehydrorhamnose 3,5-epimerase